MTTTQFRFSDSEQWFDAPSGLDDPMRVVEHAVRLHSGRRPTRVRRISGEVYATRIGSETGPVVYLRREET